MESGSWGLGSREGTPGSMEVTPEGEKELARQMGRAFSTRRSRIEKAGWHVTGPRPKLRVTQVMENRQVT